MKMGNRSFAELSMTATAVAAILTLAACGGAASPVPASTSGSAAAPSAAPSSSASAAQQAKIVVGLGQLVAQELPIWVGQDAGIFARSNLQVDAPVASATTGMASLLSGELNLWTGGGSEMMNSVANGAQVVAIGNMAPKSALRFEVAPSIKTKEDLAGKKLGVTRFGSATHTALRSLLSSQGLNPDKDVTFIQLDTPANVAAGLIAGNIQGALCSPPQCFTVEKAGFQPMYDLGKMNVLDTTAVIIATKVWVAANHDLTQRFIDGLVLGIAREKQDKALSVATLKKNLKLDDDSAATQTVDYYASTVAPSEPYATPEQFADVIPVITSQTGKLKDFDMNTVIDNSFVKSAVDRGLSK